MDILATLRDLQTTLAHLGTVQKALSDFPPDLAALHGRLQTAARFTAEKTKALEANQAQMAARLRDLEVAQAALDRARTALKATKDKSHYAAAMREVDEKERAKAAIQRPLKALEATAASLRQDLEKVAAEAASVRPLFDELHAVFLDEHANQVEGRRLLELRQADLEGALPPAEKTRFHKLHAARQGQAVVPVEAGACAGCRVKLRGPLLGELKEGLTLIACESCQRILFLP